MSKTLYQDILDKREKWVDALDEIERERERLIEEEGYEYVDNDELDWDDVTIANYEWLQSVIKFFEEEFDASLDQSGGGSAYLTVSDLHEEEVEIPIKIRVADHPQKYDADYSIELTDDEFWKDNLDMAIEASKKIQADE
jgi:hypothetical protein